MKTKLIFINIAIIFTIMFLFRSVDIAVGDGGPTPSIDQKIYSSGDEGAYRGYTCREYTQPYLTKDGLMKQGVDCWKVNK